jgi:hypothetical protein
VPLYASLVTLQILDMHSTSVALNGAGREANPIMRPVVGNQAAFVMAKVGATTAMIWATERMWHRNRLAAIGLMAGMTGMMGLVDTHNYTVLH